MKDEKTKVNDKIFARIVTVIGIDGQKLGDFLKLDAIKLAKEDNLDLVQVSQDQDKPVCKIMDYGKWKYDQKKRKKQSGLSITKVKEIKLKVGTDIHDLSFKVAQAKKFLEKGNKVKVSVGYKGRQGAHLNLVREQCLEVYSMLKDVSDIEMEPKLQGRYFTMILVRKPE